MAKYDKCPNCGGRKTSISALCRKCHLRNVAESKAKPDNYICPICGGKKSFVSATCRGCRDKTHFDYEIDIWEVDREWFIGFTGLFMGEGAAMIIRNNDSYGVALAIRLRDDDAKAIRDIHDNLGGRLLYSHRRKKNRKHGNQYEWRTTNLNHVKELCKRMLELCTIPAKKLDDIEHVLSFCEWRESIPYYWTDETRAEAEDRLAALRKTRQYTPVKEREG
jgi:hypothetical protein